MPNIAPQSTADQHTDVADHIASTVHKLLDSINIAVDAMVDDSSRIERLAAAVANLAPLVERVR